MIVFVHRNAYALGKLNPFFHTDLVQQPYRWNIFRLRNRVEHADGRRVTMQVFRTVSVKALAFVTQRSIHRKFTGFESWRIGYNRLEGRSWLSAALCRTIEGSLFIIPSGCHRGNSTCLVVNNDHRSLNWLIVRTFFEHVIICHRLIQRILSLGIHCGMNFVTANNQIIAANSWQCILCLIHDVFHKILILLNFFWLFVIVIYSLGLFHLLLSNHPLLKHQLENHRTSCLRVLRVTDRIILGRPFRNSCQCSNLPQF
ncbi:hypothetical protein D1872_214240 [compost metagenome]